MPVDLAAIVAKHLEAFGDKRRESINKIVLSKLLAKKNPYLFIARQVETPLELAQELTAATLSSSEETMFGNTLEAIAIDICRAVYGGQKSAATGIDLEFTRDGCRYLVSIKSGPNWGNSTQVRGLRQNLSLGVRLVRQNDPTANVLAVNGCCYGSCDTDYGDYRKVCGAAFWELISGEPDLYLRLVEPIRTSASNGFISERVQLVQRLSRELAVSWAQPDGNLDWDRIVRLGAPR